MPLVFIKSFILIDLVIKIKILVRKASLMSRHFQSSYHGSNDYRKYREERLGKNVDISIPHDKKSLL